MLGANPVTAIEGTVAHLLTEFLVRRWLRTVPLRTLRAVFEAPSRLEALAAGATEPDEAERIQETDRREAERRVALGLWPGSQRAAAEQKARFEMKNADLMRTRIAGELGSFQGAETAGSKGDLALRRKIRKSASRGLFRDILLERLRDFQIRGKSTWLTGEEAAETPGC